MHGGCFLQIRVYQSQCAEQEDIRIGRVVDALDQRDAGQRAHLDVERQAEVPENDIEIAAVARTEQRPGNRGDKEGNEQRHDAGEMDESFPWHVRSSAEPRQEPAAKQSNDGAGCGHDQCIERGGPNLRRPDGAEVVQGPIHVALAGKRQMVHECRVDDHDERYHHQHTEDRKQQQRDRAFRQTLTSCDRSHGRPRCAAAGEWRAAES